jgi:hypothetical protein
MQLDLFGPTAPSTSPFGSLPVDICAEDEGRAVVPADAPKIYEEQLRAEREIVRRHIARLMRNWARKPR